MDVLSGRVQGGVRGSGWQPVGETELGTTEGAAFSEADSANGASLVSRFVRHWSAKCEPVSDKS